VSFTSLAFFGCLLLAGCVFYALPYRLRTWYLLAVSYTFYALNSTFYLLLLVGASIGSYYAGLRIAQASEEKTKFCILAIGNVLLVGMLVLFKWNSGQFNILLPLGISYYSFKLISYLVEVYWDESVVEKRFSTFLLYPAFFPQIVSGPIQRPAAFFEQWKSVISQKADLKTIEEGFRLVLAGLAMKLLVGDRIAVFIGIVDKSPTAYQRRVILVLVACYTLQLYADFSGYTNIALGIGKIFGISGPPNFNAPFTAPNLQKMWQRWHMSLTSWVTDYLFTPLNMALRGYGRIGLLMSLVSSMVVIGLWHGLTVNFLVFGLWHAVFVAITAFTVQWRDRLFGKERNAQKLRLAIGMALTFTLMSISLVFWHNATWKDAIDHLRLLTHSGHLGDLGFSDIRTDATEPLALCMAVAAYAGLGAPGWKWFRRVCNEIIPNWVQYGACLLLISALTTESGSAFIYGQF